MTDQTEQLKRDFKKDLIGALFKVTTINESNMILTLFDDMGMSANLSTGDIQDMFKSVYETETDLNFFATETLTKRIKTNP